MQNFNERPYQDAHRNFVREYNAWKNHTKQHLIIPLRNQFQVEGEEDIFLGYPPLISGAPPPVNPANLRAEARANVWDQWYATAQGDIVDLARTKDAAQQGAAMQRLLQYAQMNRTRDVVTNMMIAWNRLYDTQAPEAQPQGVDDLTGGYRFRRENDFPQVTAEIADRDTAAIWFLGSTASYYTGQGTMIQNGELSTLPGFFLTATSVCRHYCPKEKRLRRNEREKEKRKGWEKKYCCSVKKKKFPKTCVSTTGQYTSGCCGTTRNTCSTGTCGTKTTNDTTCDKCTA